MVQTRFELLAKQWSAEAKGRQAAEAQAREARIRAGRAEQAVRTMANERDAWRRRAEQAEAAWAAAGMQS